MILDYNYDKKMKEMKISYVNEEGNKKLMRFNVQRFKSYRYKVGGEYDTWDGAKCEEIYTDNPNEFDIKTFMMELDDEKKRLIQGKVFPKVYTFDIEVAMDEEGEFSSPEDASNPITTISVVSPNMNCVVMGTRKIEDLDIKDINHKFLDYLNGVDFYKELGMENIPEFKYLWFPTEKDMLEFFLKHIVRKAPILTGWNCILFDWYYITNRIIKYYPTLPLKISSITDTIHYKRYKDIKGNDVSLPIPEHTLIIDLMDVIATEDHTVLPIKESMSLNYIAFETMKIEKISYTGTLDDLYNDDYPRYVYYNAIDSILVQLINYKFKTLDHIYLYSLYCMEKIGKCFSKIATTEALVFQDFYHRNVKIVYNENMVEERGRLVGAYVKKPIPGIHNYVCCNDFASLYPSTIRTCNISFENYIGAFWDEERLRPYRDNIEKYVVVGPNVFENKGNKSKPRAGYLLHTFLDEEKLRPYRNKKEYFISINGCVYKNDKDYTFRRIQGTLKGVRDHDKYLGKKADATLVSDIKHILEGNKVDNIYGDDVKEFIRNIGWEGKVERSRDMWDWKEEDLKKILRGAKEEVVYLDSNQLAMKYLMNSMYGGCSHVMFYWYNMNIANDITGESRNLTHMMEHHISQFWRDNWVEMKDLHKTLGIEVDEDRAKEVLQESPLITEDMDKDAFHERSFVYAAYGDSCTGDTLVWLEGNREKKIEDMFDNENYTVCNGKDISLSNEKIINFDGKNYVINSIKHIIRHKTCKKKYKIVLKGGRWVEVTEDHSCIIIDEKGNMKTIKPLDMKKGMVVMTMEGRDEVENIVFEGNFENEYVYDIEVNTENEDMHNFFGNGILIHNTDSVQGSTILHTSDGDLTIEEFFNRNKDNIFHTQHGHELTRTSTKVLNYTNEGNLEFQNINYIMRHKVRKPKWKLKTKSGKEVIVTNDHSMIVFRDGKKIEVKPYEILKTDKVLVVKDSKQ